MKGFTRIRWGHVTINEGEGPANITLMWLREWVWLFVYVYAFGRRFSLMLPRKRWGHE